MPLSLTLLRLEVAAGVVAIVAIIASPAAEAASASVAIGDLVLDYDDAVWRVTGSADGAVMDSVVCSGIACENRMGVHISIAPSEGPMPTEIPSSEGGFVNSLWELLDDPLPWPGEGAVREVNGFAIFASDRWSGCRAMSPSELTATLDHAGRRYTFASGVAAGCRGVWGVGREAFVEILAGLRPRD